MGLTFTYKYSLRDAAGAITHLVATNQDITQRDLAQARDRFLSQHDELTGLPNRAMLREIVHKAISHASRTQQLVAVIFVDLDGFKPVNDQFGHPVGDQLLSAVGERLRSAVRQSDAIARVGGDEFAAIACDVQTGASAAALADKLLEALSAPFMVRGNRLSIGVSVGIPLFQADGADVETLINKANQAMYHAELAEGMATTVLFLRRRMYPSLPTPAADNWREADSGITQGLRFAPEHPVGIHGVADNGGQHHHGADEDDLQRRRGARCFPDGHAID